MSRKPRTQEATTQEPSPDHSRQHRHVGQNTPFHIRVFKAVDHQYLLDPDLPSQTSISLDDYLKQELETGYHMQSVTGIVGDHRNIRVVTKYDPQAAAKHPASPPGLHPWHYRIFTEENQEYWHQMPGKEKEETLDQYLAQQAATGYHLKSLVGLDELHTSMALNKSAKLRVATEYCTKDSVPADKKRRPYT